jgi:dihydroorotate dehydrogenase (NAD+) catalytic subunit
MAAEVVSAVRRTTKRPLWVKLTPHVTDIASIARAVEQAGADALTVANTYPAMSVDFRSRRSRLGRATGGLSGRAIRPITTRLVYEASCAVQIPVIALGGIDKAEDVLEYFVVGASAIQVGTATFSDPRACERVLDELEALCRAEKIRKISDLTATFQTENN